MISVTHHLNPHPISPWPFVYALSSSLGEWGHIMQRNNGAPLCQLAPISRTYRLCQNSLAPTVLNAFDPSGGASYKRPPNSGTCHSTVRSAIRPEGGGEYLLCVAWWQHGTSSEESQCLDGRRRRTIQGVKGEQRGDTLLLKGHNNDLQQRGQTARDSEWKQEATSCNTEGPDRLLKLGC